VGRIVRTLPSSFYKCGTITQAITCPSCLGTGRVMPAPLDDAKIAASNDRQSAYYREHEGEPWEAKS
jgi:hypothetical protein